MKTLYITDLDGTLLNDKAELTETTEKYINAVIEKGADFTIATARTFGTVVDMFKNIKLTLPAVLMNGVMLYDMAEKKSVCSFSIDTIAAKKILDAFNKHGLSPLIYHDRGDYLEIRYNNSANDFQMAYVNKRNHSQSKMFTYSPTLKIDNDDKIIYFVTLDLYENIIELYNELKTIKNINVAFYKDNYTECHFLEIFAQGISKASGLAEIKKIVDADKIVAFGDNLNDLDMFRVADEAYAVSNACNELKEAATGVIGSNTEDAVAKFIFNHFTESSNG